MDGIWTFLIPERQGGGVIVARNGKLYGGDIGFFFEGKYTEANNSVHGTIDVTRFNPHAHQSTWGDNAQRFQVLFQGTIKDTTITGTIQRANVPAKFGLNLTRRADLP